MKPEDCMGCGYYVPPNCSVGGDHLYPIEFTESCSLFDKYQSPSEKGKPMTCKEVLDACYSLCESCKGRKDGHEPLVQNYLEDKIRVEEEL